MKKITFILLALLVTTFAWQGNAQIMQSNATVISGVDFVDGDTYTDSGGAGADYSNNEFSSLVFQAGAGEVITITFTAFAVEASTTICWDTLTVTGDANGLDATYSGDNIDGGASLSCTDATDPAGNPTLGPFTSTAGGTLTFDFSSDNIITRAGWEATINVAIPPSAPPIISCPGDITVGNDAGVCGAIVNFADAVAIDDVDGPIPTTQTMGPVSGSVFPVGDTIIEFSATDSDGQTSTCQFTITVNDTEAPIAVCQDLTLELDSVTGMVSIAPGDVDNGSTDNCGIASMSLDVSTFDCSMVGANTVTLTVTDAAGNTDTCTATVTIEDNTAPVIACIGEPSNFSILEDFEGATIPAGWTTDITVGAQDWTFGSGDLPTGDDFPTNAAIFDDDDAGNGAVNAGSLVSPVYDLTGATAASLSYEVAFQEFGDQEFYVEVWDGATWQQVAFYDEDLDPDIQAVTIDVLAYANADFQVRYRYDDLGGWGWHAAIDNFQLDYALPPGVPLDVVLDASGNATVQATDLLLNVDEACGYVVTVGGGTGTANTLTTTFAGGNGFDGNMFDVVALNDLTVQSFDVNLDTGITDDVEVWYKMGTFVGSETNPGDWTLLGTANVTSAGDGVPTPLNMNLGFDITAGDTVAFYVTTLNGGMNYTNGTALGNLFASDANLEFYEGNGGGYFDVTFSPRVFNGNIHYTTGGGTSMDFDCSMLGENLIDVTVTDASGNSSTCTATVNVIDDTAPIITCGPQPTVTTEDQDFESATIPTGWSTDITAGAQDWEFGSGDLPIGDDFPTWAAIFNDDAAGSGAVNAGSLLSPVYDLSGATSASLSYEVAFQEFGDQEFYVEVWDGATWQQVAFYDEDLNPNIQAVSMDILAYANADFQVRFRYDDLGGWGWHAAIDNFQVMYSVPPTSSNVIIELDENGEAVINPMDLISSVDEACGITTSAVDVTDVTCADIGTPIDVTVFVTDASGNLASCVATIEVVDNLAPVVTCPADQTVEIDAQNVLYEVPDYWANGDGSVLDNCTDPVTVFTQDPAPGSFLADGVYTVTLGAEDEYGNIGTCTFELTVVTVLGTTDNVLSSISMYPNPANDVFTITNGTGVQLEKAAIYDVNGKLVNTINLQDMTTEKTIDVSALASGVYMVQISSNNASVVKRLIKE